MVKITFYEDNNFGGCHFECFGDCPDLRCHLDHCNSIRVESGCFMIYESSDYGHQYFLRPGEYPDYHCWLGMNDSISSCLVIPVVSGSYNVRLYERLEFGGQMMDLANDCPSVMDCFHMKNIFSCNVKDGHWLFYEQANYRGRMYLVRPGDYTRFSEWGGRNARVGSIRRILDY